MCSDKALAALINHKAGVLLERSRKFPPKHPRVWEPKDILGCFSSGQLESLQGRTGLVVLASPTTELCAPAWEGDVSAAHLIVWSIWSV